VGNKLIGQRFSKHLHTYLSEAAVQVHAAGRLAELIASRRSKGSHQVLEIGCGTGALTVKLASLLRPAAYCANDIVSSCSGYAMQAAAGNAAAFSFVHGDASEQFCLPFPPTIIASASCLQWIADLRKLFSWLHAVSQQGALLGYSSYGTNNFSELNYITGLSLDYKTRADTEKSMAGKFKITYYEEEQHRLYFKNGADLLRHLKLTGVNSLSSQAWTKGRLHTFEAEYAKNFGCADGLPLTYNPVYVIAERLQRPDCKFNATDSLQ
jgi:malonyl-CoA O-methyltransferase